MTLFRFCPSSQKIEWPLWGLLLTLMAFTSVLVAPVSARAESKPFGIAAFTLQTTRATQISEVIGPLRRELTTVNNEPYQPAFTQAGGHPWALTATVELDSEEFEEGEGAQKEPVIVPTRDPKDIIVALPPGLLGNPMAAPRCPINVVFGGRELCPSETQIGVFKARWFDGHEFIGPIVNVVPERGQSAEFALENEANVSAALTAHLVRTAQGYGFTVVSNGIPTVRLTRIETTFWGVPADPSHDPMRGLICSNNRVRGPITCTHEGGERSGLSAVPFLSMGTDCSGGPETATVRADSWEEPGHLLENQQYVGYLTKSASLPGATGCNQLQFDPSIEVRPDKLIADEPVGLGVNVQVPQPETPELNATPHLRDAVVTLPQGMSISPGIVDGIQACNLSGPEGINFTGPESEDVGLNGELKLAPGHCPDASTVGEAEAITPLLPDPIKGHVYLARPGCGGAGQPQCTEQDALDGNLYQLYLELGGEGALGNAGVVIKVPGFVQANPATGQLTTKFLNNPQAPFSELKIRLNGGPRAPIDNPTVCGRAMTTSDFTPWSAPGITPEGLSMPGTPDATPFSFFNVEGCASSPGLNPGFLAGTVSPQAGHFSAFTLNFTSKDREQFVKGIQVHTPPGLLGMLSSVPLCSEPQAAQGTCSESAKIGTTRVASGAGSHPFEISGSVYLTTGYKGAPFGLSIVTNAVAGPFNLGLVVVRSRIDVDPVTSQLTVTSDPLPQIVFGVPLRLKQVTVNIDRPSFMFNPTNCNAQQITATVSGSQQAVANVTSPFAVEGCKSLAFQPSFKVSTSGHTSRASGASLDAKVTYPPFKAGSQANIAYVKVELPKQLPSRLTTLQKACTDATFTANPAACPAASIIGIARTTTPLLPVGLEGPVYFVSHGGEAFPSLIVVLQGDGVRVDLTGTTFISKTGITSSTFKTVPDVPINSFELYLPEGKYSALAANGNLCAAAAHGKLKMPTEMLAQNGAVLKQSTKIAVTGCPKTKKATKHKRKTKAKKAGNNRRAKS
jgi:hypothetical protein